MLCFCTYVSIISMHAWLQTLGLVWVSDMQLWHNKLENKILTRYEVIIINSISMMKNNKTWGKKNKINWIFLDLEKLLVMNYGSQLSYLFVSSLVCVSYVQVLFASNKTDGMVVVFNPESLIISFCCGAYRKRIQKLQPK